jgi:hypothetical protein
MNSAWQAPRKAEFQIQRRKAGFMKMVRTVLLAGISGIFISGSIFAVPLDLTFNGSPPAFESTFSLYGDSGFQDYIPVANEGQVSSINLAGVNSINVTWNAPAGYMYVVNPPPAGLLFANLYFEAEYGVGGQASSLGSITASSFSVHGISGTSPMSLQATLNPGPGGAALYFLAYASMNSRSAPFAFNSITMSLDFSGTGADTTLQKSAFDEQSDYFGILYGDYEAGPPGGPPIVPPGLGPMVTLAPLPTESTPDGSSTLILAGLGFAGLSLFGRKPLPTKG